MSLTFLPRRLATERGEEDPDRLAELFQLDHLATRMRRNDENVLVLAGADSTPPRRSDAPLVDVLQAAQSEVEQYERIEFGTVDDDVSIAAQAVNDVVRLTAELLDNATRFSPPGAPETPIAPKPLLPLSRCPRRENNRTVVWL